MAQPLLSLSPCHHHHRRHRATIVTILPLPSSLQQCHHHLSTAIITTPPPSSSLCHCHHDTAVIAVPLLLSYCATTAITVRPPLPYHCTAAIIAKTLPPSPCHRCRHRAAAVIAVSPLSFLESCLSPWLSGKGSPAPSVSPEHPDRTCSLQQQVTALWGERPWHGWASWEELRCEKPHK